jgi:hypothetical protein
MTDQSEAEVEVEAEAESGSNKRSRDDITPSFTIVDMSLDSHSTILAMKLIDDADNLSQEARFLKYKKKRKERYWAVQALQKLLVSKGSIFRPYQWCLVSNITKLRFCVHKQENTMICFCCVDYDDENKRIIVEAIQMFEEGQEICVMAMIQSLRKHHSDYKIVIQLHDGCQSWFWSLYKDMTIVPLELYDPSTPVQHNEEPPLTASSEPSTSVQRNEEPPPLTRSEPSVPSVQRNEEPPVTLSSELSALFPSTSTSAPQPSISSPPKRQRVILDEPAVATTPPSQILRLLQPAPTPIVDTLRRVCFACNKFFDTGHGLEVHVRHKPHQQRVAMFVWERERRCHRCLVSFTDKISFQTHARSCLGFEVY